MTITVRRSTLSVVAAVALALPAAALTATSAHAADGGFSPVATVTADQLVSPADGVAYTAANGGTTVTRWTADGGSQTITLPATAGTVLDLAAADGVVYVLTTTKVVALNGTTISSETALPATVDRPLPGMPDPTYPFSPMSIAADGTGVYVQGWASWAYPWSAVVRWDGTKWTEYAVDTNNGPRTILISDISRDFGNLDGSSNGIKRWGGTAWTPLPGADAWSYPGSTQTVADVTYASATDYTAWGSTGVDQTTPSTPVPVPPSGSCRHTVNGTTTQCPAPAWDITAAVRLADGRVVLGGSDRGTTPGAFAVVPSQDATPTAIPGDNGAAVNELAAAPTGSTVWALTYSAGTTTLQVANLAITPTPTPTGTATTTPTPTPTTPTPTGTPTTTPTTTPTGTPTTTPTTTPTPKPTATPTPKPTCPRPTPPGHRKPKHPHWPHHGRWTPSV